METPCFISIREFDIDKDYFLFEHLYPEYAKNSNLDAVSFFDYLKSLLMLIKDKSVIVYTVLHYDDQKSVGFMISEEIFPFICNVHIVIQKDYRNLYYTIKACKQGLNKLKQLEIKQVVCGIDTENKNATILLNRLGFEYLGCVGGEEIYSEMIGKKV